MEVEEFEEFFRQYYLTEMEAAAMAGKKSIIVDFSLLDKFKPDLADKLLSNPEDMIKAARESILNTDLLGENIKIEPRFKNLPEKFNLRIRSLRSEHIGKFVCLDGVVRRASEVKPEFDIAIYQCPECRQKMEIEQTERFLQPPVICENPECGRKGGFVLIDRRLFDARWIFIEEPFEIVTGERPGEVPVYLKGDLTVPEMQRKTDPGNRLKINCIVKETKKFIKGKLRTQMDIYVEANYVEPTEMEWEEVVITPQDEEKIKEYSQDPEIYNKIVSSIAPSIYGMNEIKEAVMLQLFGGVPHHLPDNTRIRGDIHILLIGDPSCLIADERVVMSDGTIIKIGEMGTKHLEDINYNLHMGMGRKVGKATKFHFFKSQPIIEIVTETGKSIKGTCNQPMLVLKDMERIWKRLDEIKINDRVCTISKIECRKKRFVDTKWTDFSYYHKSWHIKIPKVLDENLAGIFGYIIADGWIRKRSVGFVINKDELDIAPKIINQLEKCFGVPVSSYEHKRASEKIMYYEVNRTHLAKLLSFLKEKRVPNLVFQSRDSVVASFLRWLYEGDGSVFSKGRGRTSVSLRSNNIELLRDVQLLLLRFGIHSRILWENKKRMVKIKGRKVISKPSGSLMIRRSESITKFSKNIGFVSQKKISKLEKAVEYAKSHVHRVHKERSEKIVKINNDSPQDVFDVEVPNYHRFVANGIIVHNTGKSQLLKLISGIIPRGKYVGGKGATAAGLCVSPNSLILLEDGSFREIGKMVEDELSKGEIDVGNGIKVAENPTSKRILAFDPKNLKIKPLNISQYWKIKSPEKLIKIRTRTGREIEVTLENPLPVLQNGFINWKKANEVKEGDFIAVPREIVFEPKESEVSVFNFLDKTAHLINASEIVNELIIRIKENSTIRNFAKECDINENSLYHSWRSGGHSPTLLMLDRLCEGLSLNLEGMLPDKMRLMQYNGHVITLSKNLTEDLLYLMGLIAGDGSVSKTDYGGFSIKLHSASAELLESFRSICKVQFDLNPHYCKHPEKIPYYNINSKIIGNIFLKFGIPYGEKSHRLKIAEELSKLPNKLIRPYLQGIFDTDGSSIKRKRGASYVDLTSSSKEFITGIQILLLRFGILSKMRKRGKSVSFIRGRKVSSDVKYVLEIKSLDNLKKFKENIGFRLGRKSKNLENIVNSIKKSHSNIDLIPDVSELLKLTRKELKMSIKDLLGYKCYSYENFSRAPTRKMLQKFVSKMKERGTSENLLQLEKLANSDIFIDKVNEIKVIDSDSEYVYDLTVEGEHSFIANGLIVHNTATVVKDEEFGGGWMLEAGAMILANKGILCVDEFDKMSKDDQIAMHEGLEQQQISIAKASIVATLPAQVSVLAGSNPKFFRFDPFKSIAEQVDIPDTLLSRFDLKFALKDVPDKEKDEKLATHILETRLKPSLVEPLIAPEFLRKYIAYARKNSKPEMTREAAERLKNFYLDMRSLYSGEETVAITLRQNEGLMRLAEAAAKIRLSEKVEMKDAERAINIMRFSIQQLGYDYETGKIDIDRTEGVSASQRSKIHIILDIIDELEKKIGKPVPKEEIIAAAEDQGLKAETTEDLLRRLKSEGSIFEPKLNYLESIK
jgi:DNA replicative helicase MCM subunit Mcm2 (Cdc46/Mcm family)